MNTPSSSKINTILFVCFILFLCVIFGALAIHTVLFGDQSTSGFQYILSATLTILVAIGCLLILPQLIKNYISSLKREKVIATNAKQAEVNRIDFLNNLTKISGHKPLECTYLGGSGIPLNTGDLIYLTCTSDQILLTSKQTLAQIPLSLNAISALEVAGPGTQTSKGDFVGGGFGVEGFLKGAIAASVLNKITTTSQTNTFLRILGKSTDIHFHTSAIEPSQLKILLAPAFIELEKKKSVHPSTTFADELEKLHRLVQNGALSTEEFVEAKRRILDRA